jgi:hypothetical protein
MTTPQSSAPTPPPADLRATKVLLGKPLTAWRAATSIATVTVTVTVIAGLLMRVTDAARFPTSATACVGRCRR